MAKSLSDMTQEEQEYYWEEQRLYEQADAMADAYGGVADRNLEGWGAIAEADRLSHEYQEAQEAEWLAELEAKDAAESAEKAKQAEAVRQYDSIDEIIRKSEADYEYGKYLKKKEAEREKRREAEAEVRRIAESKLTESEKMERAVATELASKKAAEKAEYEEAERQARFERFVARENARKEREAREIRTYTRELRELYQLEASKKAYYSLSDNDTERPWVMKNILDKCSTPNGYIEALNIFLYLVYADKEGLDYSIDGTQSVVSALGEAIQGDTISESVLQVRLGTLGLKAVPMSKELLLGLGYPAEFVTRLLVVPNLYYVKKKPWWSFLFR